METVVSPQPAYLFLARFERSTAIERIERFEQGSGCVGRTETERKPYRYLAQEFGKVRACVAFNVRLT